MRKLAIWAASFSAGSFLMRFLLPETWTLPAAWCALGLGFAALLLRGPTRLRAVIACSALAASLGYGWAFDLLVRAPAEALAERTADVRLILCEYPRRTAYGAQAAARIEGLRGARAVYYGDESLLELAPGCAVTDRVRLRNAAEFETGESSFLSRRVFLLAYSTGAPRYETEGASSPQWWPARAGRAVQEKLRALYPEPAAGFLAALLTGDKTALDETAATDLSEAGIYHIMAVSGLHCSFLAMLIVTLAGKHRRRAAACAAIPALIFYALLTGAQPSVIRACVMLTMVLAAPALGRENDPPTALSFALMLILLHDPYAAASVSLQLSFGAVAGMLWLTPRMDRFLRGGRERGRVFRFVSASVSATCGALVFTLPLTAYYFNFLVLVSPVSNLLCLWAVSGAFAAGLLSVLLGFIWMPLAAVCAFVPRGLTAYILTAAHLLARIPYHALYYTNPLLKYWLAYFYVLFGTAYACRSGGRRKYAAAAALVAVSLAAAVGLGRGLYSAPLDIVAVDVGQGAAAILASQGRFAVVDCGSAGLGAGAGGEVADHLLSMGCRELDELVLTHYDYDHISGAAELMDRLRVKRLLMPDCQDDAGLRQWAEEEAAVHGTAVELVTQTRTGPLGGSILTVYPSAADGGDNDSGLAVLCSAGTFDLLITGDMSRRAEKALLAAYPLPDIEVLAVGHHGSRGSTGEELLDALRPEVGVVSVGRNRYGHPAEETLRRLTAAGAAVCRTDLQGDIHITVK